MSFMTHCGRYSAYSRNRYLLLLARGARRDRRERTSWMSPSSRLPCLGTAALPLVSPLASVGPPWRAARTLRLRSSSQPSSRVCDVSR